MQIRKIIAAIVAVPMMFSQVYASTLKDVTVGLSPDNTTVNISGVIVPDEKKAEEIIVKIVAPLVEENKITTGGDLIVVDEKELQENQERFSFTFGWKANNTEGRYYVYLSGNGIERSKVDEKYEFWFYTTETLDKKAITLRDNAVDVDSMNTGLFGEDSEYKGYNNADFLSLKNEFYSDELQDVIAKVLYNNKSRIEDAKSLNELFRVATVIAALETGNTSGLLNSNDELLSNIFPTTDTAFVELEGYFNSNKNVGNIGYLTSDGKDEVIEGLSGKTWSDITDGTMVETFKKDLVDYIIYSAVFNNNLQGHGHIADVFEKFGKLSSYDARKLLALDDEEQLDAAYDVYTSGAATPAELNESLGEISSGSGGSGLGGSSGGGGAGGSSGGKNTQIGGIEQSYVDELREESTVRENEYNQGYKDLAGYEWAKDAITVLSGKGIVNGVGDMNFAPGKYVTRAEFAKMLVNTFGYEIGKDESGFSDVPTGEWYAPYIAVLAEKNIALGSDGKFYPDATITRQDACALIYRAMMEGQEAAETTDVSYADADSIADYAISAVGKLSELGIILGDTDNNFRPADVTTRAESAVIFYRLMEVNK